MAAPWVEPGLGPGSASVLGKCGSCSIGARESRDCLPGGRRGRLPGAGLGLRARAAEGETEAQQVAWRVRLAGDVSEVGFGGTRAPTPPGDPVRRP